ncbi:sigma-70 family RNA polymerase sigma factor [Paenibacillus thailandensis]|uniref:RNA polymerase sigma factor n=1 Tax=Paenibacillus thailandensis TaxID=393250 RepID=A0ABW5QZC9_9BACL
MTRADDRLSDLYETVRYYVARRVSCAAAIEDIVQTTFLKAYGNLDKLTDASKLLPWLLRIARNCTVDYYRTRVSTMYSLDEMERPSLSQVETEADLNTGQLEVYACMREAIQQLPHSDREALTLQLNGLSVTQISERLGLTKSGAKSRIQRARGRLKRKMTGCCHIETDRYGNIIDFVVKKRSIN